MSDADPTKNDNDTYIPHRAPYYSNKYGYTQEYRTPTPPPAGEPPVAPTGQIPEGDSS